MFTVYLKSAGGTKKYFTEFETEAEAESFCREYGWEWVDENEFVWDMDYEEDNMTDEQRSFYLLLCMTGRTQEATEYREKIEKQEDNTDGENIQE